MLECTFLLGKKGGIPVLIVGAGNMVLQKNVTELFDSLAVPDTTYSTENMSVLVNGKFFSYGKLNHTNCRLFQNHITKVIYF